MATATTPEVESPKESFPNSEDSHSVTTNPPTTPPLPSSGGGDETKGEVDAGGAVTDIQKKIRRAERFGMPVQLSEEEKRNSRAERFGMGTGSHGSGALKKSEENKRKARAERFGLVQSTSADEDAKKKARLARFAPASKPDSAEEDKRKARALRFSQNQPTSLTQLNGDGKVETKVAVLGKAGGAT
ncbi:hypothetical protein ACH5RR_005399 [Cinchona calisaya]|uniref:THO1-MOS11 C-terminal domain-containing protein n=1 Tax=Cinchona calisaya TaxID=153742 RepID=A0ABD3AL48_9GENT